MILCADSQCLFPNGETIIAAPLARPAIPPRHGKDFSVSRATPQFQAVARRLIAFDAHHNKASGNGAPEAFPVGDRLSRHLTSLIGIDGFHALFSRALALAGAEFPWLSAVRVDADGILVGWNAPPAPADPVDLLAGKEVLLAQLLELLVAFVGPGLTVHLMRDMWPQFLIRDLDLANGEKNEKTK